MAPVHWLPHAAHGDATTFMCFSSGAGKGKYGTFISQISKYYLAYHKEYYSRDMVFLHDPTALLGVARKDLFQWVEGAVVVGLEGFLRGKTMADSAPLTAPEQCISVNAACACACRGH